MLIAAVRNTVAFMKELGDHAVMDKRRQKQLSKFLSYVLRHHPEGIGIKLDSSGWADVSKLLRQSRLQGLPFTLDELRTTVRENDKQRFSFSEDGRRIRANQGHSIPIDLGYEETVPPVILYHGTARWRVKSIRREGLVRGSRHHVHLSPDVATAKNVGQRYGKPIVIKVEAGRMHVAGRKFYLSANGIWLTDRVPPEYLVFPDAE